MINLLGTFSGNFIIFLLSIFFSVQGFIFLLLIKHDRMLSKIENTISFICEQQNKQKTSGFLQ